MQYHPLFTLDCNADDPEAQEKAARDVGYIHVYRVVAGRPILASLRLAAEDLPSLDSLIDQFGGGDYELVARGPDNRDIVNRVRIHIDAVQFPPKHPGATATATNGQVSQPLDAILTRLVSLSAPQPAPSGQWLQALTVLGPALLAYMQNQSQSQMNMLTALMSGNQQATAQLVMALAQLLGPRSGANQMSPDKALDMALGVIEKMKSASSGEGEGSGFSLETLGTIIENLKECFTEGRQALQIVQEAGNQPIPGQPQVAVQQPGVTPGWAPPAQGVAPGVPTA
jgi:hypothetical protein